MKVYGPYTRYDGRKYVVVEKGNKHSTMLLSRYLVEEALGRSLEPTETVDHIDRNKTKDELDNLRIVDRPTHTKEDTRRRKTLEFTCPYCGTKFKTNKKNVFANRRQGKAGPFCSRSCAGKYGVEVRDGKRERIVVDMEEFEKMERFERAEKTEGKSIYSFEEFDIFDFEFNKMPDEKFTLVIEEIDQESKRIYFSIHQGNSIQQSYKRTFDQWERLLGNIVILE